MNPFPQKVTNPAVNKLIRERGTPEPLAQKARGNFQVEFRGGKTVKVARGQAPVVRERPKRSRSQIKHEPLPLRGRQHRINRRDASTKKARGPPRGVRNRISARRLVPRRSIRRVAFRTDVKEAELHTGKLELKHESPQHPIDLRGT